MSLKITAASMIHDQEHVGHYTNKVTGTGLEFFVKYLLRPFNADFAIANASLVIIIIISSSSSDSSSSSGSSGSSGRGSDSDSTSSCGSSKILTWTGKYKSGVMAGARVGK